MTEQDTQLVSCPKCHVGLSPQLLDIVQVIPCPACGIGVEVLAFPSLFKTRDVGKDAKPVVGDDEASCFFHPDKKAAMVCESCGRFLCDLCHVELKDQHLCPRCIETGRRDGKLKDLDRERILYDYIALSLAVIPLLIAFTTIVTAPITIYVCIRYWNAPRSMISRTRARFVVAMIIAVLELLAWALLILFAVMAER